jgi:uncharacterized protein (DUF305 family)
MRTLRVGFVAVALGSALFPIACASTAPASVASPSASQSASRSSQGQSLTELEALYRARKDSALVNVSEADVAFVTRMIGHHAQALVMSGFAPDNDANGSIRTLAARITNAQTDEIALMQGWLRDREREVPEVAQGGHMANESDPEMLMPGMLTPAQLGELQRASGAEFDRTFLTYMIQHHEGAVTMVHALFATDGAAQDDLIFKLASDIQVDQITEIARMKQMLDALASGIGR